MHGQTICMLGMTGGVGGAVADALLGRGFALRALLRDPLKLPAVWRSHESVTLIPGDAMSAEDVAIAAQGCSAIFHGVNPAAYRNWNEVVLPMIDNTIAAARIAGGARIVLPGTLYNFDPRTTPVVGASSPQQPMTEKGRIRRELEDRLEHASLTGVPGLILRAGDFFGADARSSWFSQSLVRAGKPVRSLINPGMRGIGHSWAYLPDLADSFARLIAMPERLAPFERLQFEGLWDHDGTVLIEAVRRAVGRSVPERAFPWWLMRVLAPFGGFPAAVRDVEVYWRHPVRLDNSRLVELLGAEPRTPLDTAVARTLTGLGCMPAADERPVRRAA